MEIKRRSDGSEYWVLASGWIVDPNYSLTVTAPDGVIYDRLAWMICTRCSNTRYPDSLHLSDIFTDEEFEEYLKRFS